MVGSKRFDTQPLVLFHPSTNTFLQYDAIQQSLKTMTSIDKRNICIGALGYCSQADLISRTLSYALTPEILSINESDRVVESLTKHAAGKKALWEWFKSNFDEIHQKIGGGIGRFARIVRLCTEHLSTREQLEDVKAFFEDKDTEVRLEETKLFRKGSLTKWNRSIMYTSRNQLV